MSAKGVSAGTVITNIATLTFELDDQKSSIVSNKVQDIVAQLIDVDVSVVESSYVRVKNGDKDRVITFKITNIGNGNDQFVLTTYQDRRSDFNVKQRALYLDTNNNGRFDLSDQIVDHLSLEADENSILFVVSDIVIDNIKNFRMVSRVGIKAVSQRGGSNKSGEIHIGKGVNGVDAIDGLKGGVATNSWIYEVNGNKNRVFLSKGSYISYDYFDEEFITYEINVTISKNQKVQDLVIEDSIPELCIYKNNSLSVNGKKISDAKDGDIGWFDKKNNKVIVNLGTQKYPDVKRIKFKVKVGDIL